jgi:peptidoglycan/LPS O-acetylase OafA/YrhL
MLIAPTIPRNAFPWVRSFELLGKRAYGIYLTNLLVLDILLTLIQAIAPNLLGYTLLILPILGALTIYLPISLMAAVERIPKAGFYRFVFG